MGLYFTGILVETSLNRFTWIILVNIYQYVPFLSINIMQDIPVRAGFHPSTSIKVVGVKLFLVKVDTVKGVPIGSMYGMFPYILP